MFNSSVNTHSPSDWRLYLVMLTRMSIFTPSSYRRAVPNVRAYVTPPLPCSVESACCSIIQNASTGRRLVGTPSSSVWYVSYYLPIQTGTHCHTYQYKYRHAYRHTSSCTDKTSYDERWYPSQSPLTSEPRRSIPLHDWPIYAPYQAWCSCHASFVIFFV